MLTPCLALELWRWCCGEAASPPLVLTCLLLLSWVRLDLWFADVVYEHPWYWRHQCIAYVPVVTAIFKVAWPAILIMHGRVAIEQIAKLMVAVTSRALLLLCSPSSQAAV